MSEVAVKVLRILSSSRCTPPAKIFFFRALRRGSPSPRATPPRDSVSRPVTSAVILGRARKMGADGLERLADGQTESKDDRESQQGHGGVRAQQINQREDGGHETADKLDQTGADEVADALRRRS